MDSEFQAHNIALKTLRQRCEYLQQRLDSVEEENYKLKLRNSPEVLKSSSSVTAQSEQIALLNKQKSQLTHQIQMVTMENRTLWAQLSRLITGNNKLGEHLSVSAVSHDTQNLKFSNLNNTMREDTNYLYCDYNKESLEEISLKLINGILMGKNELENQYSQMIDLQKENNSEELEKCSFPSHQISNTFPVYNLKTYLQKLNDFKQVLYQQKYNLSGAIKNLKNYQKLVNENQKNFLLCENANLSNSGSATVGTSSNVTSSQDINRSESEEGSASSDMICPICAKFFTGDFKNFYEHVTDHFENENEEFEDASATFEVVP